MRLVKIVSIFSCLFLFLGMLQKHVYADNLVIQTDGTVLFVTDSGAIKHFLFSHEKFTNSHVLGASSGVIITVSLSSFIPTDTPIPTRVPTATPTPTRNQPTATPTPSGNSQQPTATPTITPRPVSPMPTPTVSNSLIATITTPSTTTTQTVDKIIQETSTEPVVITHAQNNEEMVITQGNTQATTNLPLQVSTATKTLSVMIEGNSYAVLPPTKAVEAIQTTGSYIIPSSMKISLATQNKQPIYQVKGQQHVQILGLFIITFPVTINVSANDGTITQTINPFIVTFLEFLHLGKRVVH